MSILPTTAAPAAPATPAAPAGAGTQDAGNSPFSDLVASLIAPQTGQQAAADQQAPADPSGQTEQAGQTSDVASAPDTAAAPGAQSPVTQNVVAQTAGTPNTGTQTTGTDSTDDAATGSDTDDTSDATAVTDDPAAGAAAGQPAGVVAPPSALGLLLAGAGILPSVNARLSEPSTNGGATDDATGVAATTGAAPGAAAEAAPAPGLTAPGPTAPGLTAPGPAAAGPIAPDTAAPTKAESEPSAHGQQGKVAAPTADPTGAKPQTGSNPTSDDQIAVTDSPPDSAQTAPTQQVAAPASPDHRPQPVFAAASRQVVDQVARIVSAESTQSGRSSTQSLVIRLDPGTLGEVRVHLRMHAGEVRVELSTGNAGVRDALGHDIPELHRILGGRDSQIVVTDGSRTDLGGRSGSDGAFPQSSDGRQPGQQPTDDGSGSGRSAWMSEVTNATDGTQAEKHGPRSGIDRNGAPRSGSVESLIPDTRVDVSV